MPPSGSASSLKQGRAPHRAALAVMALAALQSGSDALAACQPPEDEQTSSKIEVRVDAVRSASGSVVAVLYGDNPDDFLKKGKHLAKMFEPAQEGLVSVCLTAPNPGTYAVAVYHDENGNEKFDKTWIGLPDEGYGISNNPTILLSAPAFDEAKFEALEGSTVIDINVSY
ncbi:MAG: DUF2141 domain-containing protein [Pseudomonadota bacterium]|nr:DUF2141 domain-containing protein [Pseudomonadota bacterium]